MVRRFLTCSVVVLLGAVASTVSANDTVPYETARKNGVRSCLNELKDVSAFILKDNGHSSHDVWNNDHVDSRMISSFVVKDYSDGDGHVSLVVGPDSSGRCFAEYNETNYWPKSCSMLREQVFSAWSFAGSLEDTTIALKNDAGSVNVYLTSQDSGRGCMSTKREVIYY